VITLANVETDLGPVSILRNRRTGAIAYWQDSAYQSEADHRGISLAAYVHALHGFIRQKDCRDILLIGCGGGTLATMLSAHGARVVVIDVNAWSFALAKQYFSLPAAVECQVGDGRAYLETASRSFDAVVLDAYHEGRIPSHFCDTAFAAIVKRRLNPGGLFLANVYLPHDLDDTADRFAWTLRTGWSTVRLLDQRGASSRNAIVLAGAVEGLRAPALISPPQHGVDEIVQDLQNMQFRSVRRLRGAGPANG